MKSTKQFVMVLLAFAGLTGMLQAAEVAAENSRPTVFIIGDSTVNNSGRGQRGWGNVIAAHFDTNRIAVVNRARGGRSSRTFFTEGLWKNLQAELKPGDFVLMQFGHNDGGALTVPRNRASIKGNGDESQTVTNQTSGVVEEVHSYGWYLRQYIAGAKSKGAMPIMLSPIPRNIWANGAVRRASMDYGKWAAEVARAEGVPFIDLNEIVARRYEQTGQEKVAAEFFGSADHTHTTAAGAELNARCVVDGIREVKTSALTGFLLQASE
jgi:lysophospholipase L1-like esterase